MFDLDIITNINDLNDDKLQYYFSSQLNTMKREFPISSQHKSSSHYSSKIF